MPIIELKPIKETRAEYEKIEARIKKAFLKIIYLPLLKELSLPKNKIRNAIEDLINSISEGRITYSRGGFRGKFDAKITKELKALGASWDRKTASFTLPLKKIPYEVKIAIQSADSLFRERLENIDRRLAEITPKQLAEHIKVSDIFDGTLWKVEKDFQKSVENITVAPALTDHQAKKIADEWQDNMDYWIENFTEQQITDLRQTIKENFFAGNRYEGLIKGIQRSYNVTENKAKFLARQETALLMAKHKKVRYLEAGVKEYKWACVKMPHDKTPKQHTAGNVRYSHGLLEGKIFRFDEPPVTTAPGEPARRNNPGEDYNCRCFAIPIVKF